MLFEQESQDAYDWIKSRIVNTPSLQPTSPGSLADDYTGSVSGTINLTPEADRWIVQVYKGGVSVENQVPLQTLVAPDGTWSLVLPSGYVGAWMFDLLDANASFAPTGKPWPELGNNLVHSFEGGQLASVTFLYDQALSVMSALAMNDLTEAQKFVQGMCLAQTSGGANDGAFLDNVTTTTGLPDEFRYRTGIHAVCTDSLLNYIGYLSAGSEKTELTSRAVRALSWMETRRVTEGDLVNLYRGGMGDLVSDVFDASFEILWCSTEHNIDAWYCLIDAAKVLDDFSYQLKANNLRSAMLSFLWDSANNRFYQGRHPDGSADTADPLDTNSWGSTWLTSVGESAKAVQALVNCDNFSESDLGATGYTNWYAQPAFPSPTTLVWFEGTCGVAIAQYKAGQASLAEQTLQGIIGIQAVDGSFTYSTRNAPSQDMNDSPSVASTASFVLAARLLNDGIAAPGDWSVDIASGNFYLNQTLDVGFIIRQVGFWELQFNSTGATGPAADTSALLVKANNLADVNSSTTARANLGAASAADLDNVFGIAIGAAGRPGFRSVGSSAPSTAGWAINDLWLDTTADVNIIRRWDGSAFHP